MAFAAVTSALFALLELANPRISIPSSTQENESSEYDEYIETQWKWLLEALQCCSEVVTASDEGIIIEEARRLQDAVEFAMSTQFLEQFKSCKPTFSLKPDRLRQVVERFTKAAEKIRRRIEELWDLKVRKMIEEHIVEICLPRKEVEEEEDVSTSVADMVGLNDEFHRVRDIITRPLGRYKTLYYLNEMVFLYKIVFWISGMAGVGKTTFAKRLYHDPLVKENFECRAFVRVGREYRVERVLRAITAQLSRGNDEIMKAGDNQDLHESFCTILGAKRCLIVLDDVWNENITEDLVKGMKKIKCWGSLILLTSRMEPYPPYDNFCLKIRFLNEEESWELLRRKVFGEEEVCPPLLVEPGKKIAKKCGGLPLLINAVAPVLLSEADHEPEIWNRVAEKPNSVLEEASNQISEVLYSSYSHLHEIYKPCFLYISAFPHTDLVFCSIIMKLWYAEGFFNFLPENIWAKDKSLVFQVLLSSNIVIADKELSWSDDGEIKACSLHCAYWYLCKRIAKENRFLYIMNSYADGTHECVKSHHRLAVQTNVLLAIKEVRGIITSISTVRSLLCTGPYHQYQVPVVCSEWKLLRVLDAVTIRFYEFPVEVVNLILLKYLALTCNANLPPSISKLWRLQFLIVHQHLRIRRVPADELYVPVQIWELQELIHLEIPGRNLPRPPHPGVVLPNLEKLLDVGVESCTKGVLENIPKLKKLIIQTELVPDAAETLTCFYDIDSFQCVVMNPTLLRPPPLHDSIQISGVVKLSLSGCGYLWEEMSKIGKLAKLKVLKLRCYAFRGEKWETNEDAGFCSLKYLYIEDTDLVQWSVEGKETMQYLERLTMKNCHKLHEIPGSLHSQDLKIELIDSNPLAETWAKQYYGSDKVTASYSWKHKPK